MSLPVCHRVCQGWQTHSSPQWHDSTASCVRKKIEFASLPRFLSRGGRLKKSSEIALPQTPIRFIWRWRAGSLRGVDPPVHLGHLREFRAFPGHFLTWPIRHLGRGPKRKGTGPWRLHLAPAPSPARARTFRFGARRRRSGSRARASIARHWSPTPSTIPAIDLQR
jgi:hypothetical protein